jgi:cilia- and flagella-associated protein 57
MCHAWANENRVVAGTADSKILVFEAGELVLEISYTLPPSTGNNNAPQTILPAILTIVTFSTGMMAGLSTGAGVLFEKTDDAYLYKKGREFYLEDSAIVFGSVSPHEDCAAVTLQNGQLYVVWFDADTKVGCTLIESRGDL